MKIAFSACAEADIEKIAEWWDEHRSVGAERFFGALEEAEKTLLANPEIGVS